MIEILKEMRDSLNTISNKLDTINTNLSNKLDRMNTNLSNKLDTVSNKLDTINTNLSDKLDTVSNKLDTVINNTSDIAKEINMLRVELIEDALWSSSQRGDSTRKLIYISLMMDTLLNLFIEHLQGEGYKILDTNCKGSFTQEPLDVIITVEKDGKRKELYVEVRIYTTEKSAENIKKKFKDVHNDKWVIARFMESKVIRELKEAGINIFTYNPETDYIEVI